MSTNEKPAERTTPSAAEVEAAARAMCDEIVTPQDGKIFEPRTKQILPAWEHQRPKAIAALRAGCRGEGKTVSEQTTMKLSYRQKAVLRDLVAAGSAGIRRSCTNKTLCALEKRGLARWDMVDSEHGTGLKVEKWWAVQQ